MDGNQTQTAINDIEKYCGICRKSAGHWEQEHYLIYPEEEGKCRRCKKREETLKFAPSMMDHIHGFSEMICRPCYIEILEENLKKIKRSLKEQKAL